MKQDRERHINAISALVRFYHVRAKRAILDSFDYKYVSSSDVFYLLIILNLRILRVGLTPVKSFCHQSVARRLQSYRFDLTLSNTSMGLVALNALAALTTLEQAIADGTILWMVVRLANCLIYVLNVFVTRSTRSD
jgi:hypothetical protein